MPLKLTVWFILKMLRGLRPGEIVMAEITDSDTHDLYGRYLGRPINFGLE